MTPAFYFSYGRPNPRVLLSIKGTCGLDLVPQVAAAIASKSVSPRPWFGFGTRPPTEHDESTRFNFTELFKAYVGPNVFAAFRELVASVAWRVRIFASGW